MIFYTAVGNRVEEDSGRFVVRVGEQEKVLSEMETMIWAPLPGRYAKRQMYTPRCTGFYVLPLEKKRRWNGRMKRIFVFA